MNVKLIKRKELLSDETDYWIEVKQGSEYASKVFHNLEEATAYYDKFITEKQPTTKDEVIRETTIGFD